MRFDILTLFPDIFQGFLHQSILNDSIEKGLVSINLWNIRNWATGKHLTVDDRPFGGGPGMVIMCPPVFNCVEHVQSQSESPGAVVMLTPAGRRLNQSVVRELSHCPRLLLLCGRYEGFDDRIRQGLQPIEISVGDFVCNGGEVPAMILIETLIRLIPGVLGDLDSVVEESHSVEGMLEYPQYTRPREFRGMAVPEILLSGDHQAIARWRKEQAQKRTNEHLE
ncbi:MAG: tRNA (guanosine(37)-N1)-methyltransferase TrmD [Zavarzinella sp.]